MRALNLLAALGLLGLSSCAACARYQHVGIASAPAGAAIFLDGEKIGETPHREAIPRDKEHAVYLKKPGYRPELVVLDLHRPEDGVWFFTPADVWVELAPLANATDLERSLEIEVEERRAPEP